MDATQQYPGYGRSSPFGRDSLASVHPHDFPLEWRGLAGLESREERARNLMTPIKIQLYMLRQGLHPDPVQHAKALEILGRCCERLHQLLIPRGASLPPAPAAYEFGDMGAGQGTAMPSLGPPPVFYPDVQWSLGGSGGTG